MTRTRLPLLLILLLPLLVAAFDLSLGWAAFLLLVLLAWRQLAVISLLGAGPQGPELELETIPPSHFAEKVRWCMDRLGVPYQERTVGSIIGVISRGRTVPMLTVQTGVTRSSLCESSHILRYLHGRYAATLGPEAAFLAPTEERLTWEQRLDRYGVSLQVWAYHHLLKDPAACKAVWGAHDTTLPRWQRGLLLLGYPVFAGFIERTFQPNRKNHARALERIEALLSATEAELSDGRTTLLGGEELDFTDLTLAALSSIWLWPDAFAGGRFAASRVAPEQLPAAMREEAAAWRSRFPATTAHLDRLYATQRQPHRDHDGPA